MKHIYSLFFCLLSFSSLHAQYKVRFIVKVETAIYHDSIYITGTFNNWDSTSNKNYLMQAHGKNEFSIDLKLKAGPIGYKFTRGSWLSVEKQYYGDEVPDRIDTITKDVTFTDSVKAWRDLIVIDKWEALARQKQDTSRVGIMAAIANNYAFYPEFYNADSALFYAQKALQLQQKIMASDEYKSWAKTDNFSQLMNLQEIIATLLHALGNYPKALEIRFENLKLAEKDKDKLSMAYAYRNITEDYRSMKDYQNVLRYGKSMDSILNTMNLKDRQSARVQWQAKYTIATAFYNLGLTDSALYYANKSNAIKIDFETGNLAFGSLLLGDIYAKKSENNTAFYYYRKVLPNAFSIGNAGLMARANEGMARLFKKQGRLDSALFFASQAISLLQTYKINVQAWGENTNTYIAEISPLVAELYKDNNQLDSAYKYLYLSVSLKDSLYNVDRIRQFQTLGFNETTRRLQLDQQSKEAKQEYDTRVKMYGLISIITGILILAIILFRNNKQKQKANILLQEQKKEIENTLGELKITQKQLIQSEKMASLGELTAGIAHEIQNPLNFINNFAEINTELIAEMKTELASGNTQQAIELANDIDANEQKINHHGKRADGIVKGMLQHSRSSSGIKEPTDINVLADEYFRLAYHGLRAKDKSFNAVMKTDFDESIGNINIIPQDIGRVILNLITNAFYAVTEKKQQEAVRYEPTVVVSTKKMADGVEIKIADNGNGIPQKVLDKIFQPFFTTKPTGQGTGLGLSLSYDIVKAHDGFIEVETNETGGTTFIITLPQT